MLRARTLREGSVGLFALLGLILIGSIAVWLRGGSFGQESYEIFVEFADASGLKVGAPVRFRGVDIGKVVSLSPSSNGVGVTLAIASSQLHIPRQSQVTTSRYGLLGEASIEIRPLSTLDKQALTLDPKAEDCDPNSSILCNRDRVQGVVEEDVMASLTKLGEAYRDPAFMNTFTQAAKSATQAGDRITTLSNEMLLLSKTARQEIQGISTTIDAYTGVANDSSRLIRNLDTVVAQNQTSLRQILANAVKLTDNLNAIAIENRRNLAATLIGVEQTSHDLQLVARGLTQTVSRVNQGLNAVDTERLAKNLEVLTANAAETSKNLRTISNGINDPTLMLNLQKTLDSARVTFENVQKITSDLDDLTGDPAFRDNIRRLVDGLGNLMSSTQSLEQQVYTAQLVEHVSQTLEYQIDVQQRLAPFGAIAPPSAPAPKFQPLNAPVPLARSTQPNELERNKPPIIKTVK